MRAIDSLFLNILRNYCFGDSFWRYFDLQKLIDSYQCQLY